MGKPSARLFAQQSLQGALRLFLVETVLVQQGLADRLAQLSKIRP